MSRLTDNDCRMGPLTWGRSGWNPWRLVFSTGGGVDDHPRNHLTCYAFRRVWRLDLPTRFGPERRWVPTGHYSWAESPDAGYWDVHAREFGFCLNDGHLSIYFGPQTGDSTTEKNWGCFLPWTQWRYIRHSLFTPQGEHYWTEWTRPRGFKFRDHWDAKQAAMKTCPTVAFEFDDHDGKRIRAICRVEEREWRFGEGWFRWLSLFRQPRINRVLDLEFSSEVGPEKGSWKGGVLGTSTRILPGETPEDAFRRYCDEEHLSKYRSFNVKFVGPVAAEAL